MTARSVPCNLWSVCVFDLSRETCSASSVILSWRSGVAAQRSEGPVAWNHRTGYQDTGPSPSFAPAALRRLRMTARATSRLCSKVLRAYSLELGELRAALRLQPRIQRRRTDLQHPGGFAHVPARGLHRGGDVLGDDGVERLDLPLLGGQ